MKLVFHGCRGSVPASAAAFSKYGGHTACVEIRFADMQIIFDTGSGFRNVRLQPDLQKIILYSHWHHDHIQGLAFNSGVLDPSNKITIASALTSKLALKPILQTYFSNPYFSVDIIQASSHLCFEDFASLSQLYQPVFALDSILLNHPGGAAGYSVVYGKRKIVYLCDNEYTEAQFADLRAFVAGATIVIWDGMFLDKELGTRRGWGHSSIEQGISFFKKSGCAALLLTHHHPERADDDLDGLTASLPRGVRFAYDDLEIIQ